jgi:cytochrome c biogenesis protein CcmG, thiol:disulfide interchange protein DsbE
MSRDAKILSGVAVAGLAVALAIVVIVGSAGRHGGSSANIDMKPVAAGGMAADFKLQDLQGNTISLSSLRGKVVFLNVWATWCAPCRDEMPSIESLYEEFSKDKDFEVVAVSQDTLGRKAVAPYVEKQGLKFTVLLDPSNQVGEAYNVSGIPETFIIGRDGRIVAHHVGPFDWSSSEMRDALQELIKSKEG